MKNRLLPVAVATMGGVGFVPFAPGTAASMVTVGLLWLLPTWPLPLHLVILTLLFLLAIWSSSLAEKHYAKHDPSCVVIDEVVGMYLAVLGLPTIWWVYLLAFLFFRLFDILKPPPINYCQWLPQGWGIVMDDVAAGLFARIVMWAILSIVVLR